MANESRLRSWFGRRAQPKQEEIVETEARGGAGVQDFNYSNRLGNPFSQIFRHKNRCSAPFSNQDVMEMARNPMHHIHELRRWARWAYYANGTVTTAIDSLCGLYSLDYVVTAKTKRDGVPPGGYGVYADRMHLVLKGMRYKDVIRDALFHDANDGMYVGYFESKSATSDGKPVLTDTEMTNIVELNAAGVNVAVIPLPIDYVRIIGRRNSCYEIAFDLRYFDGLTDEERKRRLSGMPMQIQEGWRKYQEGELEQGACWLRLDWRRTIVSKIKSGMNDPYGVPFAVAALDDIEYANYFINTKRSVLDKVNNQVYFETYPEGKDKGTSALTKTQQEYQHNVVKQALTQRSNDLGVAFFSLAAGTQMDSLPVDTSLLDEENENAIKEDVNEDLGFSAAALNGSSSGNYATATLNMEIVANNVYTWIEQIVEEINKCFNYTIMRNSDYRVEFHVLPITFVNRDKMISNFADLYSRGKGSLSAWVAASGINPVDYISLMEYELENDYENRFPVHKTSFTISGADAVPSDVDLSGPGEDVDTGINPSTQSTVANNGNALPSPSE